ncbi:UPF0518 protein AGAP011705 isoform X2 [Copidosoma floridanum]|uniref:UPF0518 protein AGAP011705 isoform X2 n=1 Tax=Copidosoma floridanum TaxID=29053 RepID=UPI0006C96F90|nr:UPF0518 protein AGAP011705 isoform X2 [Copidosoma floridanum]
MSWLRSSPLRSSFSKQRSRDSPPKDADPVACYDSFRKHWQQSYDIICQSLPPKSIPSHDDVLGVVNHVDHMMTLLLLELRDYSLQQRHQNLRLQQRDIVSAAQINTHCSPCLEHLLSENLLEKLHEWSTHTGRFGDAVRLEQLKLYELLISHDSSLLAHEPVTRPLLRLLDECAGDIMPIEVQKKLVVLLNHMCVSLVQNTELLRLFFRPTATGKNRFIIFTLLVPYIHREGGVGQQARDAMLLCMSLSKKNDEIGNYIAEESHICSVLATGLSALYSALPRTLDIESEDWHRLTVDDINDIPPLSQLMNSLEFCNAVAQVVHPLVQEQLLEFLYRGFLVPVMGPALLQTSVDELVAATAYFDLFLRYVDEPGLLRSLIRFLLEENYDDNRILDHLIKRMSSQQSRLTLVTLALFETLVDLNCEDVMLELCFGALAPCSHVMLSQRRRLLNDLDPFGRCADKFLSLAPNCCAGPSPAVLLATAAVAVSSPPVLSRNPSFIQESHASHQQQQVSMYKSIKLSTSMAAESLYSNYYAYLRDARQKIAECQLACSSWSNKYEGEEMEEEEYDADMDCTDNQNGNSEDEYYEDDDESSVYSCNREHSGASPDRQISSDSNDAFTNPELALRRNSTDEKVNKIIASFTEKPVVKTTKDSSEVNKKLSPGEREKLDADIAELLTETVSNTRNNLDVKSPSSMTEESSNMLNSLQLSINGGESSGYESFAFKGSNESTPVNDDYDDENTVSKASADQSLPTDPPTIANRQRSTTTHQRRHRLQRRNAFTRNGKRLEIADGRPPSVGVFLDVLLKKLECMTENNVYVNLHLTGLISRLAIYPQPLLQSFLLNHSLVFQPSIKYLFQVLASLKHKIDGFTMKQPEDAISVLVEQARVFLISRENRLVNARKNVLEAAAQFPSPKKNHAGGESGHSGAPVSMPTNRALEPKRRSLTSSLTQIFRKSNSNNVEADSFYSNDSFSNIAEEDASNGVSRQNARHHETSMWENSSKISRVQNVVVCAVILDEWLKELAAIIQEHAIVSWFNAASAADSGCLKF